MEDDRKLMGEALDQFRADCPRFDDDGKPIPLLDRVEALVGTTEWQSINTFLAYTNIKNALEPLGIKPKHDDMLESIEQMVKELLELWGQEKNG